MNPFLLAPIALTFILLITEKILHTTAPKFPITLLPLLTQSRSKARKRFLLRLLLVTLATFVALYDMLPESQVCPTQPTLTLLIDTSVSMCADDHPPRRFDKAITLAREIVQQTDYPQIAIFTFNRNAHLLLSPAPKSSALAALDALQRNATFNTDTAIGRAALIALATLLALQTPPDENLITKKLPQTIEPVSLSNAPDYLFIAITDGMNNTGPSPEEIRPLFQTPSRHLYLVQIPPIPKTPKTINCPNETLPEGFRQGDLLPEEEELPSSTPGGEARIPSEILNLLKSPPARHLGCPTQLPVLVHLFALLAPLTLFLGLQRQKETDRFLRLRGR